MRAIASLAKLGQVNQLTRDKIMAFHKSNLGSFGDFVPCDIEGYIPENGDSLGDFRLDFADREYWETEGFDEWVASAVAATAEAEQRLEDWRRQNG